MFLHFSDDEQMNFQIASSVTSRIFTASEGGEQHCQVGGFNLAQTEIEKFLSSTVT